MYKKISDYGIIGNLHSVALVGRDGSIDWMCLPHIDSPSIFGAILDADDGGYFSISPDGEWDSVLSYLEDSNVLFGKFRTRTGFYTLTDFMTVPADEGRTCEQGGCVLVRLLHVQRGNVRVRVRFEPRFDYGRIIPQVTIFPGHGVVAAGNGEYVALSTTMNLEVQEAAAEGIWELNEGDRVALQLRYGAREPDQLSEKQAEELLLDTLTFWRTWLNRSGPGFFNDLGAHRKQVVRSLLVLKLLYYRPHGTMAAAATTSLPEVIGGVRNWDYRFSWVRDTSMALTALFQVGHVKETEGYLGWLNEIILKSKRNSLQVMYRLDGSENITEEILPHLEGFRGSHPVRTGNNAVSQKQFSIYGHVLIAAHLLVERNRTIDAEMWHGLRLMCGFVMSHWREPDWSIWEMRSNPRHFVHSKVMCWVTLDRCIRIAEITGAAGDLEQWEKARDEIGREVMSRGWDSKRQAFVLHYDSDALDGSSFLMSMSGFISFNDPRMLATVEAVRVDLAEKGFIYRYLADDGLPGSEGTFMACTLWLITNLARQGEIEEAELLLARVDEVGWPLHLLAEEYDPTWQEQLGNYPQAFSHEAYITAAMAIADAKGELRIKRPLQENVILPGEGEEHGVPSPPLPDEVADILDQAIISLNEFQADAARATTPLVERLGSLLRKMHSFDPAGLEEREEKISFWSNLFNILVLHNILALNVRESVKEIPWFYKRISCRVGSQFFSADCILNGILRGNRPGPGRLDLPLPSGDPRLSQSIRPCDPRLLFALSTGALSSPPITVLRPATLHADLQAAAESFIANHAEIDEQHKKIVLPRLFKWYDDFGKTAHDKAVFVAQFLEKDLARSISEHPESFKLEYMDYDWRVRFREPHATR
ncbi:glycoside hydrolase family 15 protein [Pelotalea chapellei]|uniref:Glycoside hydrolase family 15 protein n=1 Tax=Pelotalea chapellei TaxID=44671 RepID=A0ABS5U3U5_9BACT|nr:glycoside hydrolase family 15 protein [Pelotalea chapellei]MBT1070338.1 glycoside hydrolase family 15 protein [Pelotalea chapellei]